MERTKPHGRVIGIDLLPAQPPRGVTTFQGDFLSPMVQKLVKDLILEYHQRQPPPPSRAEPEETNDEVCNVDTDRLSYIDMERHASQVHADDASAHGPTTLRLVDVSFCPPSKYVDVPRLILGILGCS